MERSLRDFPCRAGFPIFEKLIMITQPDRRLGSSIFWRILFQQHMVMGEKQMTTERVLFFSASYRLNSR